jgi:adenosine kinase
MNLSAPFLAQFFKEQMDSVAPFWDYLIGNESEALAYAQSHDLKVNGCQ